MSSPYALESLDKLQVGHIRHFDNLSRQPPNQWELMKGKGYGQEDFGCGPSASNLPIWLTPWH